MTTRVTSAQKQKQQQRLHLEPEDVSSLKEEHTAALKDFLGSYKGVQQEISQTPRSVLASSGGATPTQHRQTL